MGLTGHGIVRETAKNNAVFINSDVYMATVVSVDPATNVVIVAPDGEKHASQIQAIPLLATFCAAIGFQESMLPTVGTRVFCAGRMPALFIGSVPFMEAQGDPNSAVLPNKAILGVPDAVMDTVHSTGYQTNVNKCVVINNGMPTDVAQGDKVFANEFGVMLGLFKLLATLKGSELAQVQCHFLDDLVRVISHNFQHFTSLGELKVFHDGQGIHLESGATHIPAESLGQSTSTTPFKTDQTNSAYNQFYSISDPQLVMLERMKLFVGQLGQFINLLIINPAQVAHAQNGTTPAQPDLGLLQIKASLDGTLVVRSVSGIYLEKTNWIRVPTRIRAPEDPTGDDGTTITYPETPAFKFSQTYEYRNTAFLYYLQLRDYLAYINEGVGYANFNAQTKDFYVNQDKSKETQLEQVTYVDKETGIAYTQTKSWVSLMSNGGVSLADAWGSSISMEGGNIYIQPAKDLVIQPNRNLIAKVGGNTTIATKGEIDLSSTQGGLRVKTDNAQYLYSKNGGILLHTDGQATAQATQSYPSSGMMTSVAGIVLNAPNSSVNSYGPQVYHKATETCVTSAPVITLDGSDIIQLLSDDQIVFSADAIEAYADEEILSYSQGNVVMLGLTNTTVGLKGQNFGLASIAGYTGTVTGFLDPANNADMAFFTGTAAAAKAYATYDYTTDLLTFKKDTDFTGLQFQFPPTALYNLDQTVDVIPQTLSQQTDMLSGVYGLNTWAEEQINSTYPYPGAGFPNSLVTSAVNNISVGSDQSNFELANATVNLLNQSTLTIQNIFTQYKST